MPIHAQRSPCTAPSFSPRRAHPCTRLTLTLTVLSIPLEQDP